MSAVTRDVRWWELADVAAVVLGEHALPLDGWQQRDAIAAMTALGHSHHHIAAMLCLTLRALQDRARQYGITLHKVDQRNDEIGLMLVCDLGIPLRIRHMGDRIEGVRRMAPTVDRYAMARLLGCNVAAVVDAARRGGIELLPKLAQDNWIGALVDRRYAKRVAA